MFEPPTSSECTRFRYEWPGVAGALSDFIDPEEPSDAEVVDAYIRRVSLEGLVYAADEMRRFLKQTELPMSLISEGALRRLDTEAEQRQFLTSFLERIEAAIAIRRAEGMK